MADIRRLDRPVLNDRELQEHYADLDRQAATELARLIPDVHRPEPPQPDFDQACVRFGKGITSGDPSYALVHSFCDVDDFDDDELGIEVRLDAMSASVQSFEDPKPDSEGRAAVAALSHEDWLAVAVSLAQAGPGADASAAALVRLLSGVREGEHAVVSRAFEYLLPLWQLLGVVDDRRRVTRLGCWAFPHVLYLFWTDYGEQVSQEDALALSLEGARADWELDPGSWDKTLYREAAMLLAVLAAMPELVDLSDAGDGPDWDPFLQAVHDHTGHTREGANPAYLLGFRAEWRGDVELQSRWIRAALTADPDHVPALRSAAAEASDRGDAAAVRDLLRRTGMPETDPELEPCVRLAGPAQSGTSRNAPCPCGSGCKFKACCMRGARHPLDARAGWVWQKVTGFARRPQQGHALVQWLLPRLVLDQSLLSEAHAPLLLDAMLFDGGQLDRFLEVRGPLLPVDELDLVGTWRDSRRAAYEVVAVRSGAPVSLRDLQTDEVVDVAELWTIEPTDPFRSGDLLLGRVVTVGTRAALVLCLSVPANNRDALQKALSSGDAEPVFVLFDRPSAG